MAEQLLVEKRCRRWWIKLSGTQLRFLLCLINCRCEMGIGANHQQSSFCSGVRFHVKSVAPPKPRSAFNYFLPSQILGIKSLKERLNVFLARSRGWSGERKELPVTIVAGYMPPLDAHTNPPLLNKLALTIAVKQVLVGVRGLP